MTASQQRHARRYARARFSLARVLASSLALAGTVACAADDAPADRGCDLAAVVVHVQGQFRTYGPQSQSHEYFGFIYRVDGELASAVVRSSECRGPDKCTTNIEPAARQIPRGAKVLGEWHTHPHLTGSRVLSNDDVRGANHNARIRCYQAYYAGPGGEIYRWDPHSTSVPTAMSTRETLGNYRLDADPAPTELPRPLTENRLRASK